MEKEYDKITAHYYSMYRPPLHHLILERCLDSSTKYGLGLDIGCGVGHSSIALSEFSNQVIGIDPSLAMIKNAKDHPSVQYQLSNGGILNFDDNSFDLITFAGSLYYAKSQLFINETIRVCKDDKKIIVYDFQLQLDSFLTDLIGKPNKEIEEAYNHKVNFSDLITNDLLELISKQEELQINNSLENIIQLLLSVKDQYIRLCDVLGNENLAEKMQAKFLRLGYTSQNEIDATIYYTIYKVKK